MIVLICLSITSCGIFRKYKRSEKSLDKVESTKDVKVNTDLTVKETGRVEENTRTVTSSDGQTKVYTKPGAQTTIAPDGTITTEADSIVQNTKQQTDAARNMVGEVTRSLDEKKDSVAKEENTVDKRNESKESERRPIFGSVFLIIIICFISLLVIWFLIKFKFR
ncbi:hypothetical protein [Sphingobacterium chungjuense]|uniref:hypothetical protein n=1 Tax=Sphingobacterium chungjuense TaxID=2675553 RepID=UPI00140ABA13|nr:hypothetical protein [Sphingobacterium chungjuense]